MITTQEKVFKHKHVQYVLHTNVCTSAGRQLPPTERRRPGFFGTRYAMCQTRESLALMPPEVSMDVYHIIIPVPNVCGVWKAPARKRNNIACACVCVGRADIPSPDRRDGIQLYGLPDYNRGHTYNIHIT